MKFSKEQLDVINTRDKNMLVSASAGSGKTTVLSKRIISLLEEGNKIDRFLIFTFTKASAGDMKNKIYSKLSEKIKEETNINNIHLKEQLKKMPSSDISTIHSFCMKVVKESFYYLNLPPKFNIATNTDEIIINSNTIEEILERKYKKSTDIFIATSEYFEDNFEDVIFKMAKFLEQKIDVSKFLDSLGEFYNTEDSIVSLLDEYKKGVIRENVDLIKSLLKMIFDDEPLKFTLEDDLEKVEALDENFIRIKSNRKLTEEQKIVRKYISDKRKEYKDEIKNIVKLNIKFELENHKQNFEIIKELISIALEFNQLAYKKRISKNLITFSDLEILAKKALDNEEIANIYKRKYDFIFVDEYQDTSDIQEYIISKIARGNNVFMVGDLKQSIYSFRQANPKLFIDKYNKYIDDENSKKIDLNNNYRSSSKVIDCVNEIFNEFMTKEFGGLDYKNTAQLVYGNKDLDFLNTKPKFVLIKKELGNDIELQFEYICSEIKRLVKEGKKYSDIVVLSRNLSSSVSVATKVLRKNDIPFYFDYSDSYLSSLEVLIVLNYLRLINNYKNDIAFLSVIRLPRYNFTDDEIYQIRKNNKKVCMYEAFKTYDEDKNICKKIDFFMNEIKRFRLLEFNLSLDELIQKIYHDTYLEKYIYTLDNPKQRLSNIRLLFSISKEYENSTLVGLNKFLKYIEALEKKHVDFSQANVIGDDSNVVKVTTIHKSKGLEFDTVFLINCHKKFNEKDYTSNSYIFKDDFIELDYIDLKKRKKSKSFIKKIIVDKLKLSLYEEELRLLYVALTRAKNLLYMVSVVDDFLSLDDFNIKNANSFLKYMNMFYHSEFVDVINVDSINIEKQDYNFKYELEEEEIIYPAFSKSYKAYKKSVSSIVHNKSVKLKDFKEEHNNMQKGTEFHKIMQWIDMQTKDVEAEFTRLINLGIIDNRDSVTLVKKFFESELYEIILISDKIGREVEFVYREKDYIQGIIDLVIQIDGEVIIVDYKTDKTLKLIDEYKEQINYYADAYSKISKKKVKAKYLYFVRMNKLEEVK